MKTQETTLYIYDPNKFDGHILNSMPFVDVTAKNGIDILNSTYVHYTGDTFKEYNKKHGGNLVAQTWDEFCLVLEAYETKKYIKPFKEITEGVYYDGLECLPPCKWHDLNERFNSFYISEATTSHYHSFYIKDRKTGKYYSATRSKFIKDSELISELEKQFN